MSENDRFTFTTKLWQRSQNSYASTIPHNILAIKGVPTQSDVNVRWSLNDAGEVIVDFEEVDE
ncbi:hypothetical protein [Natrinema sp. 1APR25-10V2]|uniref:hypothetical protein n=1 Tax=Natrinema sp. 1APR25-10V2 TaxID=2951081 RepID=UPI002876A350|nr:hypothetical protein [Natrinema sp. 1APR25-10V2]MDS0474338.1 hypothetical protein [Natrinema sp. 1APR25-10V2]